MKSPIASYLGGFLGIMVGLGFIMPAIAKWQREGPLPGGDLALLALGVTLTLGGLALGIRGFKQRRA